MIVGIIIGVIVLILIWFIATYNSLVVLRNKKDNEWSQIDVQLKRRADLIPNLVETVKGYAKHESETLEDVVKARNTYVTATTENDKVKASNELEGALTKLFALAESYPDLKANTNWSDKLGSWKRTDTYSEKTSSMSSLFKLCSNFVARDFKTLGRCLIIRSISSVSFFGISIIKNFFRLLNSDS